MNAPSQVETPVAYDALPPTQPITLPMRDEFGAYFTEWDSHHEV